MTECDEIGEMIDGLWMLQHCVFSTRALCAITCSHQSVTCAVRLSYWLARRCAVLAGRSLDFGDSDC